ncbi:MAG TPA: T9SS type A sorting domain-containing protein [Saprospiraceae bacterium]|nr:T9SS type A sorting domain-containing protein [Saprospiraceae bacterium]
MKKANSTLFFNALGWLFALALSLSANNAAIAQCNMICNDLVQITLDDDCETEILPDMILEGNGCPNGNFQVQAKINGVWTPGSGNFVATAAHINLTLPIRVKDLISGNSCTGLAHILDVLPPVLDCEDISLNCAVTTYTPDYLEDVLNIAAGWPDYQENCTNVTLTYIDQWFDLGCSGSINGQQDISAYVIRKWTAEDESGNTSTCNQYIYFERRHSTDVFFPPNVTVDCSDPVTDPNTTGVPYVQEFGVQFPVWPNGTFCELNATFQDLPLPVCDGTHKILRTWTIYDWCRPNGPTNPLTYTQIIKVEDSTGPELDCPEDMTVGTNPNDCQLDFDLPDVIVSDNCSRLSSIEAQFMDFNGIMRNIYGTFTTFPGNNPWDRDTLAVLGYANNLGIGVTTVKYIIKDDCGNITECVFDVTVEDSTPPNVSCDQNTKVALNVDGMALVNAETFDDGSYDNCAPEVYFKVRRMNPNGCQDENQFHDQVKFCCEDIGDTVQVILRVYDVPVPAGDVDLDFEEWHANDCMVWVLVEDKIKPTCTPPNNVNVNCENFDPSLWAYGKPEVYDNCCLDSTKVYQGQYGLTHSVNYSLFDTVCNKGTITRTFRSFDCYGNSSQCTQRIFVNYKQQYFVKFPNDVIVTSCDGTGNYGEPLFFGKDCELMGVSFQDEVFTVVPDACFKIERTWKIINWCTYNPNGSTIFVPNPNPNPISNAAANLPGPTVSACGTIAPWAPTVVRINPTDPQPTNFCTFWDANANSYVYKQIIKISDGQAPTGTYVAPNCSNQNWFTANNAQLWNEMYWWDNGLQTHDLCEEPTDLCITGTDACSGNNINIEYLLFLDLDGDGTMETVVNSVNTGIAGLGWNNVLYNNLNTPNFSGGTPRQFDERPVPANQKYGFAIQETINGNNKVACVRFNTQQQQNNFVVPELPHGTHKIKWFITDGCGNNSEYEYTFTVKDCKAPTVVCLNGLSVNIMPTGMITLWASDFLQYTEDNCTPANQIKIGIRKCGTGTGFPVDAQGNPITNVTFNCDEVGQQCVELWAIDAAGNADYCETYVIVQDNLGSCSGNPIVLVSGALKTEMNEGVEEANVQLFAIPSNGAPVQASNDLTDNLGVFMFANVLPVGSDYIVVPEKDDNPLNGVTTYDLVLISKHILGLEPLNSPYKMIAADANKSGSITTFDIVEIRKMILGIYNELPANTSWRFVDKDYVFPNANNPFQELFPETKTVQDMQLHNLEDDFVGVKIGDVNNSVVPNSLVDADDRSMGTLYFDVEDRAVKAGEVVEVKLTAAEKVAGYQFTMDLNGLQALEVIPGENMGKENFAMFDQAVTASVNGEAGEFAIRFRATRNGQLSEMLGLGNSITRTEAYAEIGSDVQKKEVMLRFNSANGSTLAGAGFELLQNAPNPTKGFTNISFNLPEAVEATLTVTNAEGKVVKRIVNQFAKGFNTITLQRAELEAGILFYQLDTPTHSATKKMIVVE